MDYSYRNNFPQGGYSFPMYSRIGGPAAAPPPYAPPPPPSSNARPSQPQPSPSSSGPGIRVAIKPEYIITPPPQLTPLMAEVPRSTFQFDFEFERKVLAEAEKDGSNWSRIAAEHPPPRTGPSNSATVAPSTTDPVVDKYVNLGLGYEAVSIAVLNYGDNNVKVREFVNGFNTLREMGFPSKSVGEVLAMYDNDTDKALAHLLNSSS